MLFKTFTTAALALVVSILGLAFVAAPASADNHAPAACPTYTVSAETTTDLTATPSQPGVGDTFTATATVNIDNLPATGGTVSFTYAGTTKSATVVAGEASVTFTAVQGTNTLSAVYSGQCLAEQISIGTSGDSLTIIAGVEAGGGGDGDDGNGGGANRPGPVGGTSGGANVGGLGSTGFGGGTQLVGLLGAALVAAGAFTLVARRRIG